MGIGEILKRKVGIGLCATKRSYLGEEKVGNGKNERDEVE